ncbi:hypothetical protein FB459_3439 [Yimella lutea]|uniref:Spermidine synthase n=1 Tax=Yimella lutea TaxID=587872 RepID=A0A542EKI6_9MICO|nr:fused MFS/spermidine synthase [Yimella lutea]TQJ15862.1 hypothetical protein FB459_3439 [Yimella lutea]
MPSDDNARIEFRDDERGGVTVLRDGHPQSYVDVGDPGLLAFEYVQHFASVLDLLPAGPLAVTHVGGAALTLPRYVQHTRPGSPQIVLEPDAELTQAVREKLPLPRGHRIRVRPTDGWTGLQQLADASADAVVIDAFDEGRIPGDLVTTASLHRCSHVLKPNGVLLFNIADRPERAFLKRVLATAATAFDTMALLTTTEVMKKKRFGNYVLIASSTLDEAALGRRAAASDFPTAFVRAGETAAWARSAKPIADPDEDPAPPPETSGTLRFR